MALSSVFSLLLLELSSAPLPRTLSTKLHVSLLAFGTKEHISHIPFGIKQPYFPVYFWYQSAHLSRAFPPLPFAAKHNVFPLPFGTKLCISPNMSVLVLSSAPSPPYDTFGTKQQRMIPYISCTQVEARVQQSCQAAGSRHDIRLLLIVREWRMPLRAMDQAQDLQSR